MKIGNFDNRIGKSILSVVLVGTIAACVTAAPRIFNLNSGSDSDISRGYYSDEDVKKNKAFIMNGIVDNRNKEAKTYGKKKKDN